MHLHFAITSKTFRSIADISHALVNEKIKADLVSCKMHSLITDSTICYCRPADVGGVVVIRYNVITDTESRTAFRNNQL